MNEKAACGWPFLVKSEKCKVKNLNNSLAKV